MHPEFPNTKLTSDHRTGNSVFQNVEAKISSGKLKDLEPDFDNSGASARAMFKVIAVALQGEVCPKRDFDQI